MGTSDGTVQGTTRIVDNGPANSRFNLVLLSEGYQSGDMTQWHADAQAFATFLEAARPFDDPGLRSRINVFRVDITSTDRGADKPGPCFSPAVTRATYFDGRYCASNLQRLLVVDDSIARGVLDAQVPEWHQAIVVVNDSEHGGSGGGIGVTSRAGSWQATALHEMGHSAFGLADEYESWAGCGSGETTQTQYTGAEPLQPNITIDTNRNTIEWAEFIDAATAMPTTQNSNCAVCDPQPNPVGAETSAPSKGRATSIVESSGPSSSASCGDSACHSAPFACVPFGERCVPSRAHRGESTSGRLTSTSSSTHRGRSRSRTRHHRSCRAEPTEARFCSRAGCPERLLAPRQPGCSGTSTGSH